MRKLITRGILGVFLLGAIAPNTQAAPGAAMVKLGQLINRCKNLRTLSNAAMMAASAPAFSATNIMYGASCVLNGAAAGVAALATPAVVLPAVGVAGIAGAAYGVHAYRNRGRIVPEVPVEPMVARSVTPPLPEASDLGYPIEDPSEFEVSPVYRGGGLQKLAAAKIVAPIAVGVKIGMKVGLIAQPVVSDEAPPPAFDPDVWTETHRPEWAKYGYNGPYDYYQAFGRGIRNPSDLERDAKEVNLARSEASNRAREAYYDKFFKEQSNKQEAEAAQKFRPATPDEVKAHDQAQADAYKNANRMNQHIQKGRPGTRGITRIDKGEHDQPGSKPHVHFDDGTALNFDGTVHDRAKGIPNPTKDQKEWLKSWHWSSTPKAVGMPGPTNWRFGGSYNGFPAD